MTDFHQPTSSSPNPTLVRRPSPFAIRAIGVIAVAVAIAAGSQLLAAGRTSPLSATTAPRAGLSDPGTGGGPAVVDLDAGIGPGAGAGPDVDTARIRENIAFWTAKLAAHGNDFVAAEKLGESHIELARATGDLTAYVAAETAFGTALRLYPAMPAARAYRGVVLVSLHRFDEARNLAASALIDLPDDPTSLATLGDANLELGDVAAARTAYERLAAVAPGAAASVRLGHLAFITGDSGAAVRHARAAVVQADEDEESVGERAGFYRYQLADTLLASGDRPGAVAAYREAIARDPRSFLAHAGLGRALAADGKIDQAIDELSAAIAIVPQPDMLARRADLFQLRNNDGDAKRSEQDRATVLAIAKLGSAAGTVYDRTLALYLANHGLDTGRAVQLASAELVTRKDVYGHDALAWALLADGRAVEADAAIRTALAVGTRDARILYHSGMIAAALGDLPRARTQLKAALELDPSFDALQVERAKETLAALPA